MGRLIDADELVEHVKILGIWDEVKNKNVFTNDIKDAILGLIGALPTAYDPDKVVEQLEDEVKEYDKRIERRNGDCYFNETEKIKALEERARGIERAIEIVKGCGADGD